jgi:hypothetical protein
MSAATTKPGKDVEPGDRIQLEDGSFARVTELVRAPVRMVDEDGKPIRGLRWAYLQGGGHATIAADDVVTVAGSRA